MIDIHHVRRTFGALTGHRRIYPWQERLYTEWFHHARIPEGIGIPPGLGKTSVMVLWLMALLRQLQEGTPRLPLRFVHVLDRHATVDQATDEAERLAANLHRHRELAWMRRVLAPSGGRLFISTPRGRHAGDRSWLRHPFAPAIIIADAETIESGLHFSGWGVRGRERMRLAAMLAVDTLMVLDEASQLGPFRSVVEGLLGKEAWPDPSLAPPLRLLPMTSACDAKSGTLRLKEGEHADEDIRRRLEARKRLRIERVRGGPKKLTEEMTKAVASIVHDDEADGGRWSRGVVFCSGTALARAVAEGVRKRLSPEGMPSDPHLRVRMAGHQCRILERERLAEELRRDGFLSGSGETREERVIFVTDGALEGESDIDADWMVCDLVSMSRMLHRIGHVNRAGRRKYGRIIVVAQDRPDPAEKEGNPFDRVRETLQGLGREFTQGRLANAVGSRDCVTHSPTGRAVTEMLWRRHLPWRGDDRLSLAEMLERYLRAAPPHPLEILRGRPDDVAQMLIRGAAGFVSRYGDVPAADEKPALVVLSKAGVLRHFHAAEQLAGMEVRSLAEKLEGHRCIACASLGGLDGDGLLDPEAGFPVFAADADWPEDRQRQVGFRAVSVSGESLPDPASGWRRVLVLKADGRAAERLLAIDIPEGEGRIPVRGENGDAVWAGDELAATLLASDPRAPDGRPYLEEDDFGAVMLAAGMRDLAQARGLARAALEEIEEEAAEWTGEEDLENLPEEPRDLLDDMFSFGTSDSRELRDLALHLLEVVEESPGLADLGREWLGERRSVSASEERHERLLRRYGPWGLAWLEILLVNGEDAFPPVSGIS